jgi:PEP-CTERM motif-containing protein
MELGLAELTMAILQWPVPEPSSILLFGAGILAIAVVLRRRKRP